MSSSTKKFFQRPPRLPKNDLYGAQGEIKTFYENPAHKEDSDLPKWVEWAPPLSAQRKKKKWDEYAIRLYRTSEESGSVGASNRAPAAYVEILSPHIRTTLRDLPNAYSVPYDGKDAEPLKINFPFIPLYLARHEIAQRAQTAEDSTCREHLGLLLQMIEEELGETIDDLEDLEEKKQISYHLLWALFLPGSLVLEKSSTGVLIAYRVLRAQHRGCEFHIFTEDVRFDGSRYVKLQLKWIQPCFFGSKPVTELVIYPFDSAPDSEGLKDKLRNRGRRTLDFQNIAYVQYLKKGTRAPPETIDLLGTRTKTHSPVMIDFHGFLKETPFDTIATPLEAYGDLQGHHHPVDKTGDANSIQHEDDRTARSEAAELSQDEQERNRKAVLEDPENLVLMYPYLLGFSLTSKTWQKFDVERIIPIESSSDAYDHLVFSQKSKDLACALVEDHKTNAALQDDLIAGKGQGLLILLSGPPGTGKTLMAEAVADKTQSPLYYVDTQDLGGVSLDSKLVKIMENATNWNAVLLLDEADVYISQRVGNVTDNEIVSTFLRRLEYFKGTIFLTTNLIDRIDRALESRIHVHLRFSNLPKVSRTKVWKNFIAQNPELFSAVADDDIKKLGDWIMNGREIKNALKMTAAWCRQTKEPITSKAINDIISITCPRASKENAMTDDERRTQQLNTAEGDKQVNGTKSAVIDLLDMEDLL